MRAISPAFQAHLSGQSTTVAELFRLRLDDGRVMGITSLDRDIEFDNMTWRSINGMDASVIATDTKLSVGNAEVSTLLKALEPDGLTFEGIQSGVLDNAEWDFYLINYQDTSQYLLLDSGDIGEVTAKDKSHITIEALSYAVRTKQNVGTVWSRRCRAIFGSEAGSQKGCGVNANLLWQAGEVLEVSTEPRRVFKSDSPLPSAPVTGRVRFTSGQNAGPRLYQVESYDPATGVIALIEATRFDIAIGDTIDMRPDCDKTPDQCKNVYDNFINYKGEPWIPLNGRSAMFPLDV